MSRIETRTVLNPMYEEMQMSVNLKELSIADLLDLQKAIPAELESRQKEERQKLLNEFKEKAKSLGISLDDLVGARKKTRTRGGKVAAKYIHPQDGSMTWSGRGKRPRWVNEWIAAGNSLEQIQV